MDYRADVDGLRAIAVASVIVFHADPSWLPGGFVGVDIFFVISGFVITKSLIANDGVGFSVLNFYERRCRRILPALVAMMAIVAVPAALLLIPTAFQEFGQSVAAAVVGVSNVLFWRTSGYFDQSAPFVPLLHTWSLGVEEQFYLVFPPYLMLARRYLKWSWATIILPVLVVSLAISVVLVKNQPMAAFYLPFGRMFELAIGCLIAVGFPRPRSSLANELAAFGGLALLASAFFAFTEKTPFPGFAALLPCMGTAMMIWSGSATRVGRALSWGPLVFVGLLSYSLYLWHWPVLVFARIILGHQPPVAVLTGLIALTGTLGYLSWRFVEQPFRHKGSIKKQSSIFVLSGAAIAAAIAFGIFTTLGHGLPGRFSPEVQAMAEASRDINPRREACDAPSIERIQTGDLCVIGADQEPATVLIGDSFAEALMPGVEEAARRAGESVLVMTRAGCRPLLGSNAASGCGQFQQAVLERLKRMPSIEKVVVIGRWSAMVEGQRFGAFKEAPSYMVDNMTTKPSYTGNQAVFERSFSRLIASLGDRQIFVVGYLPEQDTVVPQTVVVRAVMGASKEIGVLRPVFEQRQRNVRRIFQSGALPPITVIDASKWLCNPKGCPATDQGYPLYFDDNHLNRRAALKVSGMFDEVFP